MEVKSDNNFTLLKARSLDSVRKCATFMKYAPKMEFYLRLASPHAWLCWNRSVFRQNVSKCEFVTNFSLLEVNSDDSFTLLIARSLASSQPASSLKKLVSVIKYAPQSPPAVVVGISPSLGVTAYTAALEPFRFWTQRVT